MACLALGDILAISFSRSSVLSTAVWSSRAMISSASSIGTSFLGKGYKSSWREGDETRFDSARGPGGAAIDGQSRALPLGVSLGEAPRLAAFSAKHFDRVIREKAIRAAAISDDLAIRRELVQVL